MHVYYSIKIKMNNVKEIDIKNGTYYFFDDMFNIQNLDPNKSKLDEK